MAIMGDGLTIREAIGKTVSGSEWEDSGGSLRSERGWMESRTADKESDVRTFMVRTSHRSAHGWESSLFLELCAACDWVAIDNPSKP